ncbi:hypothetical protein ABK040_010851 [Willaertia magna]
MFSTNSKDIVFKSGKLIKQGSTVKNWKERYCLLKRDGLYYHEVKKNQPGKLKGKISFKEIKGQIQKIHKCTLDIKGKAKQCVSIETPARVYILYCESELELNDWFKSLQQVLTMKDDHSSPSTPTSRIPKLDFFNGVNTNNVDRQLSPVLGGTPRGSSEQQLDKLVAQRIIGKAPIGGTSPPSGFDGYSSSPSNSDLFKAGSSVMSDSTMSESDYLDSPLSRRGTSEDFDAFEDVNSARILDSDIESEIEQQLVGPSLSEDDEYNIAMCAAEIFLKSESERSPQEQAYIIALKDYKRKLEEYAKKHNARPEYSLALGTIIFLTPENERSTVEQEYVKDVMSAFFDEFKAADSQRFLPLQIQADIVKGAQSIFEKPVEKRTEEEKQYLIKVQELQRQLFKVEVQNGLRINYSLSSLMLNYTREDLEYSNSGYDGEDEIFCDNLVEQYEFVKTFKVKTL